MSNLHRDHFGKTPNKWSEQEERTLFTMHKAGATIKDLLAALPKRPEAALRTKMFYMGLSTAGR